VVGGEVGGLVATGVVCGVDVWGTGAGRGGVGAGAMGGAVPRSTPTPNCKLRRILLSPPLFTLEKIPPDADPMVFHKINPPNIELYVNLFILIVACILFTRKTRQNLAGPSQLAVCTIISAPRLPSSLCVSETCPANRTNDYDCMMKD
jgi:hypothetical protein